MKHFFVFVFVFVFMFLVCARPVAAISTTILINEIQITGGTGNTDHDFVELLNTGNEPYNLKGHRLVKRTKTGTTDTALKSWTSDTIIPPGGYYLWASKKDPAWPGAINANESTTQTLAADNGIALRQGDTDTGTIIDSVAWGSAKNAFVEGSAFEGNPGGSESITRTNGVDTDQNRSDFTRQPTPTPEHSTIVTETTNDAADDSTSEEENVQEGDEEAEAADEEQVAGTATSSPRIPEPAPKLLLSEVFPNPYGNDETEFIELTNTSDIAQQLDGWVVSNDHGQSYTFPQQFLMPQEFVILRRNVSGIVLQNDRETVRLIPPKKTRASDTLSYTKAPDGQSRIRTGAKSWAWTVNPTPGWSNVAASLIEPPVVVFTAPKQGETGTILLFDASDSFDPQGWKVTFHWDFGDGMGTSTDAVPIYIYTKPGTYTITLVVKSSEGLETTKTVKVTITGDPISDPEQKKPTAAKQKTPARTTAASVKASAVENEEASTPAARSGNAWVEGIVTVPPDVLAKTFVYIECTTPCAGEGVKLRMTKAEWPLSIRRGDMLRVSGTWSATGGETTLLTHAAQVEVIPARKRYTIATPAIAALDDTMIHAMLTLEGEVTEKKSTLIYLDDGHDEITVEVKDKNDRAGIAEGDTVRLTGVLTKNEGGYRLRATEPPLIVTKVPEVPMDITIARERDPVKERTRYLAVTFSALLGLAARPLFLFIRRKRQNGFPPFSRGR